MRHFTRAPVSEDSVFRVSFVVNTFGKNAGATGDSGVSHSWDEEGGKSESALGRSVA